MVLTHERRVFPGFLVSLLCLGLFAQGCAVDPNRVKQPAQQTAKNVGERTSTDPPRIDLASRPSADMPELPLEWIALRPNRVVNAAGRSVPGNPALPNVPVEISIVARANGRPVTPRVGAFAGGSPLKGVSDAFGRVPADIASFLRELPEAPTEIEVHATIPGPPASSRTVTFDAEMCRILSRPMMEERAGDDAFAQGKGLVALDRYTKALALNGDSTRKKDLWGKIVQASRSLPIKPALPEDVRRMLVQADALAKRDEGSRALPLLEQAKQEAPWFPPIHYNLAMMHAMNKEYAGAIAAMTAYLEIAPDAPDARKAKDKIYEWETMLPASGAGAASSVGGVGLEIGMSDRGPVVRSVMAGGPAQRAGARTGDTLVEINNVSSRGMDLEETVGRLRGQQGTSVGLLVLQSGTNQRALYRLVREALPAAAPRRDIRQRPGVRDR